ncbi:MAG: UDP-N-acetylmuramoyl-L-alanyl-D-glutamate--2,6-diaminopimelate ligase [Acidimicrobiia bacterium]|nr:UDP-N-acetylmuramoyl-L-alanyl-D-glutamate--2,6-diaminopimelate ligase [Acidimicrobiia bacterium]
MPPSSPLSSLADAIGGEIDGRGPGAGVPWISDVTHDSRQAGPGILFTAIRGQRHDGHDHVADAVRAGSPAVCVDHPTHSGVAELIVADTRSALGPLAAEVHGHPSRAMSVVGVTGTNGKTTVTHNIESIAASAGLTVGLMGTITTRIAGKEVESKHTTPEASDFQRTLATMRARGVSLVACEVSSHALALERVSATRFSVAAFTNLSHDHLDFHGDMASYLAAKRRLFTEHEVGIAVVNLDDTAGAELARELKGELIGVGDSGDVRVIAQQPVESGTQLRVETPWGVIEGKAPVLGVFNVANLAMAIACCLVSGIGTEDVAQSLSSLRPVPGRFELVSGSDPIRIIVDYAHTPDGIKHAIEAARSLGSARVIAVVGAGGDRDREKRPLMGSASSGADLVVVTSDNPRSEDPAQIADEVLAGIEGGTRPLTELDRTLAVHRAVAAADEGDIVLVLGRGHEPFQEASGALIPLDDRDIARRALQERRESPDFGTSSGSMSQ